MFSNDICAGPLSPTPISAVFWFAFWVLFFGYIFYKFLTTWEMFIIQIIGFLMFTVTSLSDKVRVWRGLKYPPGYLANEKDE